MMDTLQQGLELFVLYGLPVLPYAAVALVVYQIMSQFVKPLITSHRHADGTYHSAKWRFLRRGMVFYPLILGVIASLVLPHLVWWYCVAAAASSQLLYVVVLKKLLAKQGITLPALDTKSMYSVPTDDTEE